MNRVLFSSNLNCNDISLNVCPLSGGVEWVDLVTRILNALHPYT